MIRALFILLAFFLPPLLPAQTWSSYEFEGKNYHVLPEGFIKNTIELNPHIDAWLRSLELPDGDWVAFDENTEHPALFGKLKNGNKVGIWSFLEPYKHKDDSVSRWIVSMTIEYDHENLVKKYVSFYPDGVIRSKWKTLRSAYDGPIQFFYENGVLSVKGEYYIGSKVGQWKQFGREGKLVSEINYVDRRDTKRLDNIFSRDEWVDEDFLQGWSRYWNDSGYLLSETRYEDGNMNYAKVYNEEGHLEAEGPCGGNKKVWKGRNRNPECVEDPYCEFLKVGEWKVYKEDGQIRYKIDCD